MKNHIRLTFKTALFGLLLALVSQALFAQTTHVVKGTVSDRLYQDPVIGANVVLVGTTIGTVTDAEGKFEFPQRLKEGDKIQFTFVGYKPATFTVGNETGEVLTLHMELDIDVMIETAVADPVIPRNAKKGWIKDWF
jgi:hypothetical protein